MSDKLYLKGSVSVCCGDLGLTRLVEISTLQTSKIRWDESNLVMLYTRTHDKELQYFVVWIRILNRLSLKKKQFLFVRLKYDLQNVYGSQVSYGRHSYLEKRNGLVTVTRTINESKKILRTVGIWLKRVECLCKRWNIGSTWQRQRGYIYLFNSCLLSEKILCAKKPGSLYLKKMQKKKE